MCLTPCACRLKIKDGLHPSQRQKKAFPNCWTHRQIFSLVKSMPKRQATTSSTRETRSRRRAATQDDSSSSPVPRAARSDATEPSVIDDVSLSANGPEAPGNNEFERTRARFLDIARDRAAHFAHFSAEDAEESGTVAGENVGPGSEADQSEAAEEERDWPGPFETAKQLVERRAAAAEARSQAQRAGGKNASDPAGKVEIPWRPKWEATEKQPSVGGGGGNDHGEERGRPADEEAAVAEATRPADAGERSGGKPGSRVGTDGGVVRGQVSRLYDLCLAVVSANAGEVESLEGVPDAIRRDLSRSMSVRRAVDGRMLRLLLAGVSRELVVADCSLASEDDLREALATCDRGRLEVSEGDRRWETGGE